MVLPSTVDEAILNKIVAGLSPPQKVNALHSVEFREACISPRGDEAVMNGAKVIALTAADLLSDPAALDRVRLAL